jgi:DNA-binding response OmpR family regulator
VRVLVLDDHAETRQLLTRNLALASHGVKAVATCGDAETALALERFDLAILDVMLPDGSGVELCARLRAARVDVPILLLTALGDVPSRVVGLEAGADDYLPKPFALAELRARVTALGRRGPVRRDRVVVIGPLAIDRDARRVSVEGRAVALTAKELAIVDVLAARRGRVVARDALVEAVWGEVSESALASLEVLVARIRRKLGGAAAVLRTMRGVGYAIDWDA